MIGTILKWLGCFVILVIIAAGVMIYMAASAALRCEHALQSIMITCDLVSEYVKEHKGAWPRSWEDLENLPARERNYPWPEMSEWVQRYVEIDFDVDVEKINTESVEKFSAIRPLGPCFSYEHRMEEVLRVIRECRWKKEDFTRIPVMTSGHKLRIRKNPKYFTLQNTRKNRNFT